MTSTITSHGLLDIREWQNTIFYEQEGNKSGPAILFIHGLGGTTNTYQSLVSSFQDYNLVRFDFRGHGRSPRPTSKTSIEYYVQDCEGEENM